MTLAMSSPRAKSRWLLLAAIVTICTLGLGAIALASHGGAANGLPGNYAFVVTDQQGANDVPGQVDLTQMGRDDSTAGTYKLFWSWDSISAWTGQGQTGDACALFDTDNDTNINWVVCVRVENLNADPNDVRIRLNDAVATHLFECSDKKNDRCTNPIPRDASTIQAGALGTNPLSNVNLITHTDPFPAGESYNHDSTVEVHIPAATIVGNEVLVNVCSYPSAGNGGNNNPFDCIVTPGGGFLVIEKDAGTGVTSPNFTFDAHRVNTLLGQRTIAGTGTASPLPILVGGSVRVTETNIDAAWELTNAACTTDGAATGTFSSADNWVSGITIQSGKTTTCVFTDRVRTGTIKVIKNVVNDNGGTAAPGDFTMELNDSGNTTFAGSTAGTTTTLPVGASYNVTETGPAGYTMSTSGDCSGTIAAGVAKVCTVTNDDDAPSLVLEKTVVNDNGGTASEADFTLTATGPTNLSGAGPTVSSGATFSAGTYALSETGPSGYSASSWTCTGDGTQNGAQITLGLGESATCSITNDDDPNQPSIATTMSWIIHDSATVSGLTPGASDAATATIDFKLYSDAACATQVGSTETRTVTLGGGGTTASASTVTGHSVSPGTYYWRAFYSGDQFNLAASTDCGDEVTTVSDDS